MSAHAPLPVPAPSQKSLEHASFELHAAPVPFFGWQVSIEKSQYVPLAQLKSHAWPDVGSGMHVPSLTSGWVSAPMQLFDVHS